ncbi:hypothetical protein [Georgenia sp. Z1491]|uniref:hypothetical protein n=1 Tax=Georgenia sp. Z1491 TaxID=3416707 RepID=UPI003CEEC9C0
MTRSSRLRGGRPALAGPDRAPAHADDASAEEAPGGAAHHEIPDDEPPVERAQVPLPPGAGWPALRSRPGHPEAGAEPTVDRSRLAPTADSPPTAPPEAADSRGSGARPAPRPGTALPAPSGARPPAGARVDTDEERRATPTGPTARRALPRTVFHGLQSASATVRPDQARPTAVPSSVEIEDPSEGAARPFDTGGGAGAAVGLPRMSDDAPGRAPAGGAHAWRGPTSAGPGADGAARSGRRRRPVVLIGAAAALAMAVVVGATTYSLVGGDDLSSNLGHSPALSEEEDGAAHTDAETAPGAAGGTTDQAPENPPDAAQDGAEGGAPDETPGGAPGETREEEPTRDPGSAFAPPGLQRGEREGGAELRQQGTPERVGTAGDLSLGDCLTAEAFADRSERTELVGCDEPFQAQVVAEMTLHLETFPGEDAMLRSAAESCSRLVDSDPPPGLAASGEPAMVALAPTAFSFGAGDRTILCVATTGSDDEWFEGSLLDEDSSAEGPGASGPHGGQGARD